MSGSVDDRLARLFKVGELQSAGSGEPQPGELFRGPGWFVAKEGDDLRLHYISGEMAGREKLLAITPEEADLLREGGRLNDILIAHGAG